MQLKKNMLGAPVRGLKLFGRNWLPLAVGLLGRVILLGLLGSLSAWSQPTDVLSVSPGVAKNTNVDDPLEPVKDSLSERGSHNFSDMGSWIWDTNTIDRQTVRFWKSFEIPDGAAVMRARLIKANGTAANHVIITVASLVALYRTNEPPGHVRRALANGVKKEELIEFVTHLAFYGGWPVANSAIPILRKAFEEESSS